MECSVGVLVGYFVGLFVGKVFYGKKSKEDEVQQ